MQHFALNTPLLTQKITANNCINKMKNSIPGFNFNIALKTEKISQLFSRSAKAENLSIYDSPESIYHFVCDCQEDYIGMCLRPLYHRLHEHGQPSRGGEVFLHKTHCVQYKKSLAKVKKDNSYQYIIYYI